MRFWSVLALVWLLPASALAVGEGEASLSLGAGCALTFQGDGHAGVEGEFRLLRGLGDAWSGRLGLQAALLPSSDGRPGGSLVSQAVGLTWAVDIANLVPFVDFGVLVADVRGMGQPASQRLGGQAGLGFDYLVSRHALVSLLGRVDYLPLRLAGGESPRPIQLCLVLHLGRTF
jgi:hypothetical protein